jgi:hypothetical protein
LYVWQVVDKRAQGDTEQNCDEDNRQA